MASLLDLLKSGQLGAGPGMGGDALEKIFAMFRPDGGIEAPGVSVAPASFGSLAPLPTTELAHARPAAATQYEPPAPAPMPAPTPATPRYVEREPDVMGQIGAFVGGLSGKGGIASLMDYNKGERADSDTLNALLAKGVDETTARGLVANPVALQKVLAGLFSGGGDKYGKSGAVFQGEDGKFYTAQFSEDGTRKIEPLDGLAPARGVKMINDGTGTQVISGATGDTLRRVETDVAGRTEQQKLGAGLAERALEQPQAQKALEGAVSSMERLTTAARELKNSPGLSGITGLWSMVPNRPGSNSSNAAALLENLKSQVGFSVLQAMRDASKTGGALGAISDQENILLQNNLAALQGSQSYEEFVRNVDKVIADTEGSIERMRRAYQVTYPNNPATSAAPAASPPPDNGGWGIQRVQ